MLDNPALAAELIGFLQASPIDITSFLLNLPVVALVIWMVWQFQRWYSDAEGRHREYLEKVDTSWRDELKETRRVYQEELKAIRLDQNQQIQKLIDNFNTNFGAQLANQRGSFLDASLEQRQFYSDALSRMEAKITRNSEIIDLMVQQLSVNTSAISEIAKMDDIVEMLIQREKHDGSK